MSLSENFSSLLLKAIQSNPNSTIAELTDIVRKNDGLANVTLGEALLGHESVAATKPKPVKAPPVPAPLVKAAPVKAATPKKKPPTNHPPGDSQFNPRTEEGRAAIDDAVVAALTECGGWKVPALKIRGLLKGLNEVQIRTSLNRLIDEERVKYTGKARSTVYYIPGAVEP